MCQRTDRRPCRLQSGRQATRPITQDLTMLRSMKDLENYAIGATDDPVSTTK